MAIVAQAFGNTSSALGGTSVLILVAVSLETFRAVESRALMVTYDQYSRDDFFYDDLHGKDEPAVAKGSKLRRLLPKRQKKAKDQYQ